MEERRGLLASLSAAALSGQEECQSPAWPPSSSSSSRSSLSLAQRETQRSARGSRAISPPLWSTLRVQAVTRFGRGRGRGRPASSAACSADPKVLACEEAAGYIARISGRHSHRHHLMRDSRSTMSPPPVTMLPPPLLPTFRLALVSGCATCQTKLGRTRRAIERHMPHKTCISCNAGSRQTCCSSSSTSAAKAEGGGDLAKKSQGNQSTIDPAVRSNNNKHDEGC